VAVLLDEHDALLLVERDDADGPGMVEDLADLRAAAGHRDLVTPEREDRPPVDGLAAAYLVVVRHARSLSRAQADVSRDGVDAGDGGPLSTAVRW